MTQAVQLQEIGSEPKNNKITKIGFSVAIGTLVAFAGLAVVLQNKIYRMEDADDKKLQDKICSDAKAETVGRSWDLPRRLHGMGSASVQQTDGTKYVVTFNKPLRPGQAIVLDCPNVR